MIFPRRSVTPNLLPTIGTGLNTRDAVEGRPNVGTEHGTAVRERSRIVVDNVSDFFACLWTILLSEFEVQEMYEGWTEEKNWNLLEAK